MGFEYIQITQQDSIVRVTLDRPPVNVLHIPMMRELRTALEAIAEDETVSAVVITGHGRAFCAGVDIADHTADRVHEMLDVFHGAIKQTMQLPVPVIAAINGAALGGGLELALASDLIIAVDNAKLGQPEIQLAVFPPAAAVLMPRRIGRQHAMDLILTGRTITADEGERIGLVHRAVPADQFESAVDELVSRLAGLSRPVLRLTKRVVSEGMERSVEAALDHAEAVYLDALMELKDPHEGLAAFTEKRSPVWRHR